MGPEHTADAVRILLGAYYRINYVDKRYPCDCECHTIQGCDILHFAPCCYDMTYSGIVICTKVWDDDWGIFDTVEPFLGRRIILNRSSIVKEVQRIVKVEYI